MEDRDTAVRRFIFGAAVIILAAVLIWFIFLRNKQHAQSKDVSKANPSSAQSAAESSPASTQNSTSATVSNSNTSSTSTQQHAQLANVGPGNTTAIFIVASTIAAAMHYSYRRRTQFSKVFITRR